MVRPGGDGSEDRQSLRQARLHEAGRPLEDAGLDRRVHHSASRTLPQTMMTYIPMKDTTEEALWNANRAWRNLLGECWQVLIEQRLWCSVLLAVLFRDRP